MKLKGRDWLGAAATLFALAVTFNAEYEIAIAVHINPIVAYAVPGALDVYVLRALQVKRDVFLTVLAMVAVNAASHLVTAGVLRVSPALIVGVSAIAPLVLWRAHVLRHAASTERRMPWTRAQRKRIAEHVPETEHTFPDVCPTCLTEHGLVCPAQPIVPDFDKHAAQAVDVASTGTVNVPVHDSRDQLTRAWHAKYIPGCTCPVCSDEWDGDDMDQIARAWGQRVREDDTWDGTVTDQVSAFPSPEDIVYHGEYETSTEARVLSLVPPLPAGFEHVLADGDKEFLDRARALSTPTIRALKELGMGNDRARRIKQYLETEHNGGTA